MSAGGHIPIGQRRRWNFAECYPNLNCSVFLDFSHLTLCRFRFISFLPQSGKKFPPMYQDYFFSVLLDQSIIFLVYKFDTVIYFLCDTFYFNSYLYALLLKQLVRVLRAREKLNFLILPWCLVHNHTHKTLYFMFKQSVGKLGRFKALPRYFFHGFAMLNYLEVLQNLK